MILVGGEALFDIFLAGEDGRGRLALDAAPGGSPFNVAIGLARLGRRVGFFGGLSRDLFGERLAALLAREGVDLALAKRFDAPTTLAFVELLADRSARYSFRGEGAADRALTIADLPPTPRALILGSYSMVVGTTADALLALAREMPANERCLICDPNIRPTVEPNLEVWRDRFAEISVHAGIVKASAEDVALLGYGEDLERFAHVMGDVRGVPLTVVTRGADGAFAYGAFGRVDRPAPATEIVDTVGAGDTVTAAMAAWLDERNLLSQRALDSLDAAGAAAMLDFAMRAAAITCSRRGADLPRRSEIGD